MRATVYSSHPCYKHLVSHLRSPCSSRRNSGSADARAWRTVIRLCVRIDHSKGQLPVLQGASRSGWDRKWRLKLPARRSPGNGSEHREGRRKGSGPAASYRGRRSSTAHSGSVAPLSGPRPRAPSPCGPLALTGCLVHSFARPPAGLQRC